jgi:hypothetical protein
MKNKDMTPFKKRNYRPWTPALLEERSKPQPRLSIGGFFGIKILSISSG